MRQTPNPNEAPGKRGLARLVANVKCEFQERKSRKEKENPADRAARLTANATRAIAWLTGVLAVIAALQLYELIEGGRDTSTIAGASQKQVSAANRSADAAKQFADTAASINQGFDGAVSKLDAQAKATQRSANAAASAATTASNQLVLGERPWLSVKYRIVKPLTFNVEGRINGPTALMTIEQTIEMWVNQLPSTSILGQN